VSRCAFVTLLKKFSMLSALQTVEIVCWAGHESVNKRQFQLAAEERVARGGGVSYGTS
jgi:hypothetical protein